MQGGCTGGLPRENRSPGKLLRASVQGIELPVGWGIHARAAATKDSGVMPGEERHISIGKLRKIDPEIGVDLEEEQIDRYETTINRIKAFDDAGFAAKLEQAIEHFKPR